MKNATEVPARAKPDEPTGAVLSNRPGEVTTIWRDGDVVREDAWGRRRLLPSVDATPENAK